ncbi:MAG: ribonuclease HII [Gammaproteobacteria bacterium]|nr:ribonuclease HII [Gammaproteobacteria bacterium]
MPGLIAGVDEAGRGPLAGRVYAAAVILAPETIEHRMRDSKRLSAQRRERLYDEILHNSVASAIAWAEVDEIAELNILWATMQAMRRAVLSLAVLPEQVLIDGNRCPELSVPALAIVGGDDCVPAISAASILAKVARDRHMLELDVRYPEYGFAKHKGYPTAEHLAALRRHGPCPEHRQGFGPVASCMASRSAGDD